MSHSAMRQGFGRRIGMRHYPRPPVTPPCLAQAKSRAGAHLEVVFCDAQVHGGVGTGEGLGAHRLAVEQQLEAELLLVQGRGGEQCRPHAAFEPLRRLPGRTAHVLGCLRLARSALRGAVAERQRADQPLFRPGEAADLPLAEREGCPARVQPERLGREHEALAVVARALVQVVGRLPDDRHVIAHVGKLPVARQHAGERPRLVEHDLHAQAALAVAGVQLVA